VYGVLTRNANVIAARSGRRIEIAVIAVRNVARAANIVGKDIVLVDDPLLVVNDPEIDVVVEVIGGTTVAKDLVLRSIANGKHVVTANKALLAVHGTEIFAAAHSMDVVVSYEGAVAVSIPIIKALREGLSANRIEWVAGIINGTTNYIMTQMKDQGLSFNEALADAQHLGYAEADPAFDVQGIDAAHKLTLLASNAFGVPLAFDKVHIEGITEIAASVITHAERLGYSVKLLGIAKRSAAGLELRVHPTLIPIDHLLAHVHGSMNAVMVKSDAAGVTMYYGAGAGSEETASAVIADLVDLCRAVGSKPRHRVPALGFQADAVAALPVTRIEDVVTGYFLAVDVIKSLRAAPMILGHLAKIGVKAQRLEAMDHPSDDQRCTMLLLTEPARGELLRGLITSLEAEPWVLGSVRSMRVEVLQ
jgi:homoserine dehydrogenase